MNPPKPFGIMSSVIPGMNAAPKPSTKNARAPHRACLSSLRRDCGNICATTQSTEGPTIRAGRCFHRIHPSALARSVSIYVSRSTSAHAPVHTKSAHIERVARRSESHTIETAPKAADTRIASNGMNTKSIKGSPEGLSGKLFG